MPQPARRIFEAARRVFQGFGDDDCGFLAGGIAYQLFFAMVPLLALLIGVFGLVFGDERSRDEVASFVRQIYPTAGEEQIEIVGGLIEGRGLSLSIGVLGSAWSATAIYGALDSALAGILGREGRRQLIGGKLQALLFVAALGALAILSFAASYGLQLLAAFADEFRLPGVVGLLGLAAPVLGFLPGLGFFYLVFRLVPRRRIPRRLALQGALVSAVLWEVAKLAFAALTRALGTFEAYGALAFAAGLLTWVYVSAAILLIGAEVMKVARTR